MMTITRRDAPRSEVVQEYSRSRNMLLACASGLLLALAFPPVPFGHTALVALVPFLFLLERQRSFAGAFRYSYLAFLVANFGTIYWISGWWGDDPWLKAAGVVVNLVHPLLFTIPGMLLYFIRRRLGPVAMGAGFPFLWTTWEWLAHLPELSFPWMLLANTQTYDHIGIQYITVTGTFGITLWIASINALLYIGVRHIIRGTWHFPSRPALALLATVVLLLLLPKIHGTVLLRNPEAAQRTLRIGIVQPDIDPYEKWGSGETPLMKLQKLLHLYDSLAQFQPDLVLMPETAIPFRILQATYREEWLELRRRVDSSGVALLTGFPYTVFYDDPETAPGSARRIPDTNIRYHDFNAAMLVEAGETVPQVYKKSRLTPLSERIPYLDALPFMQDALTWGVGISNWGLGNDTTVFTLNNRPTRDGFWAMICYETLYPSFVAGFAARGANAFGVITNDGWFGPTSGPYQLQRYTVLRAIENRRAIARCANNGVSCFINKYGEVRQETKLYTQAAILDEVESTDEITFYARHGDWLPIGTTVATGLLLLLSFIAVHYKK
ncbi:MAG: apolipoprotein N-acyltransferase [Bacteroidia bacterium]|nr:apolipoprotein N-acyltransferase [Bacteroidia bacterium]